MLTWCENYGVQLCFYLMCTSYLCKSVRFRRCLVLLNPPHGALSLRFRSSCSNPTSGSLLKMALKSARRGILMASLFSGWRRCVGAWLCAGLGWKERCSTGGYLSSPGMRFGSLDARILSCRRCRAHVAVLRLLRFVISLVPRHRKLVYRILYLLHKDRFSAWPSSAPRRLQLPPCHDLPRLETSQHEYYVLLLAIGCSPLLFVRLRKY